MKWLSELGIGDRFVERGIVYELLAVRRTKDGEAQFSLWNDESGFDIAFKDQMVQPEGDFDE